MGIFHRINTSIHRFYYKNFSRTKWKIVRYMNTEFVMYPLNYIDRRMWIERGYEKEQLKYLLSQTKKHHFDAFIDIGANFGLYSCIIGTNQTVPTIHSFECDPRNIYHLYGHLRINNLMDKILVHPYAAGDKTDNIKFQIASDKSTGHSHVRKKLENYNIIHSEEKDSELTTITVEQKSIDEVLDYKNKTLLFKIDVEGYETIVLKGMTNILKNNSCFLQIEIIDDDKKQLEMLSSINYKKVHKIGNDWYFSNFNES